MDIILKKNEDGIVQVTTSTQTQETAFGVDEIKRQIKQHAEVINDLQKHLEAVQSFESGTSDEATVTLVESAKPLINAVELDKVVKIVEKVVEKVVEEPTPEPIIEDIKL